MATISKLKEFKNDIKFLVDKAKKPLVWLDSFDYNFIIETLSEIRSEKVRSIYIWESATGNLIDINGNIILNKRCPLAEYILHSEELNGLLVAKVSEVMFEKDKKDCLTACLQKFVYENNKKSYDHKKTILLISSYHFEVKGLEHLCERLEMSMPDKNDIRQELCLDCPNGDSKNGFEFSESFKLDIKRQSEKLIDALHGMYLYDIINLLKTIQSESLFGKIAPFDYNYGNLDERVKQGKKQIVKNSGLLEVIEVKDDYDKHIADINNLRNHLEAEQKLIGNTQFLLSKLPKPKGILLVGAPGCGKSESAKAAASILKLPLYRLNIGDLLGHKYGQSENRFNEALRTADGSAPCVLWIDEIEKAFAGAGSGDENNDVLTHIIGRFLTWMQEHETLVYLVATANNLSKIRPELLRKGRWDKVFYLTYPSKKGRIEIIEKCLLRYHLKLVEEEHKIDDKKKKDLLSDLQETMKGMSGADITSLLIEAAKKTIVEKIKKVNVENISEKNVTQTTVSSEENIDKTEMDLDIKYLKEEINKRKGKNEFVQINDDMINSNDLYIDGLPQSINDRIKDEIIELEIRRASKLDDQQRKYLMKIIANRIINEKNANKHQFSPDRYNQEEYEPASSNPDLD